MKSLVKTKIIATLGPGTGTEESIKKLIKAGAKIFRLNSSHGTPEDHKQKIEIIRKISNELNLNICILLDLQGPKIRVGTIHEPLNLENGQSITLMPMKEQDADKSIIPVDYKGIVQDVRPGDKVLLDDGKITLVIISKTEKSVKAKVIHGGVLTSKKGLNIPGATSSITAVTPKDVEYIKFAIENDVDYLALSFVRNKEDILTTKRYVKQFGGDIPIIAKIEKPQALQNLDEIIEVSDGAMVARGDLGIEISPEKVPIVQKQIIEKVNKLRKPIIVATQMLESMITQPIPTRAEASDVANAIIDGTDAVMLSGETAVGQFPVESIRMMQSIAQNVECSNIYKKALLFEDICTISEDHTQAIASAIIKMAKDVKVDAIIAFTRTGASAFLLSKEKPSIPIIAISDSEKVCRRLNLLWGVFPVFMSYKDTLSREEVQICDEMLINKTFLKEESKVVITGGLPFLGFERTNFIRLHKIGFKGDSSHCL
ncbi:MAG: pyruvate kinase [Candidatus Gastranaerophilales bacterium]|nr:pyruvate kinase [Candidatus Gastranaerophilales bacterium]